NPEICVAALWHPDWAQLEVIPDELTVENVVVPVQVYAVHEEDAEPAADDLDRARRASTASFEEFFFS
ncbi:MAG TPA: hypothetical protein PL169_07055, partial [Leptospiraceae bacterium]|nr:hypothetical protein [Leptospiraceae bacterium]